MDQANVNDGIERVYERLSPRLKKAARFILDKPEEVALNSMRVVAAKADVHPSAMVRLARELNFASYNELRDTYRGWLRQRPFTFAEQAKRLVGRGKHGQTAALISEMMEREIANLQDSFATIGVDRLVAAQKLIREARRVYVVGLRSLYPVAFYFNYACRMFMEKTTLLDGHGGSFADELRTLRGSDVMLAVSYTPYSQDAVRAVAFAAGRKAKVIALTDSPVSPIVPYAAITLKVSNSTASLFPSIVPAIAVAQTLVALLVAESGEATLASFANSEEQLRSFQVYVNEK